MYTRSANNQYQNEQEEEYSDEYNEEDLIETDGYYFSSESASELSEDDLEYNQWVEADTLIADDRYELLISELHDEKETEMTINNLETPTQILAYMEAYHNQTEANPDLHLRPLTYEQQNQFDEL